MTAVIIRIALRYGAGLLIAKGFLSPDIGSGLSDDPDVLMAIEMGVGVAMGIASEAWYFFARRWGWAK